MWPQVRIRWGSRFRYPRKGALLRGSDASLCQIILDICLHRVSETLNTKMNWLKNYERIISIEQQLVWQPVSEIDPRTYVPEVSSFCSFVDTARTPRTTQLRVCSNRPRYETAVRPSVRPSVCLSHHATAAAACGGLLLSAVRPGVVDRQQRRRAECQPAAAPQHSAQQQTRAVSRLQPT